MKKLLFILALCLVSLVGNATTGQYTAAQVAQLKTDLAAGTYDIYELTESATYSISSSSTTNLTIGGTKTNVTIRAASILSTKPIIKLTSSATSAQLSILNSGITSLSLTFSGIELMVLVQEPVLINQYFFMQLELTILSMFQIAIFMILKMIAIME